MRVEFVVKAIGRSWQVSRGITLPLEYLDFDSAVSAAENFARAATQRGDSAVIRVMAGEALLQKRSFAPETFQPRW